MAATTLMILALLDCVPGTLLKPSLPKSSQASYIPEGRAIYGGYLAIARCWTSIVGFAVWEVTSWRADFSASDIVYVTDVLATSVLLQCTTVSAMRLENGSAPRCGKNTSSSVGVFVLCRFCFERLEEQFNRSKLASPALLFGRSWNQFSGGEVTCLREITADYARDVAADKK